MVVFVTGIDGVHVQLMIAAPCFSSSMDASNTFLKCRLRVRSPPGTPWMGSERSGASPLTKYDVTVLRVRIPLHPPARVMPSGEGHRLERVWWSIGHGDRHIGSRPRIAKPKGNRSLFRTQVVPKGMVFDGLLSSKVTLVIGSTPDLNASACARAS